MVTSAKPADSGLISEEALAFIEKNRAEDLAPRSSVDINQLRAEILEGFRPAAERAITRHKVTTNEKALDGVPYLEIMPAEVRADVVIFYCFGGGYITGSPFEDLPITAALAEHTGARVISVDYPLSPEHPYPAALNAARELYASAMKDTAIKKVALVGESAGGNLALALIQQLRCEGKDLPDVMALLSPWCDLTNLGDSLDFNAGRDPTLRFDADLYASNSFAGDNALSDPKVSPIYGNFDSGFPPVIITTGTRDLLMSNAVRLTRVMRNAGIETDLRVWEGLWHVFEFYDDIPEAALSLAEIGTFLNTRFGKS